MTVPEKMKPKASHTGGVEAIPIAGRMIRVRERLLGMTDEERAWRAQWLKDQYLAPDEPVYNPEYYRQRYNPLRRFYRWPLDQLENGLKPKIGAHNAGLIRYSISSTFFIALFVYSVTYYFKYNQGDWTRAGGFRVTGTRPTVFPGDPDFPNYEIKPDQEFGAFGFEKSQI